MFTSRRLVSRRLSLKDPSEHSFSLFAWYQTRNCTPFSAQSGNFDGSRVSPARRRMTSTQKMILHDIVHLVGRLFRRTPVSDPDRSVSRHGEKLSRTNGGQIVIELCAGCRSDGFQFTWFQSRTLSAEFAPCSRVCTCCDWIRYTNRCWNYALSHVRRRLHNSLLTCQTFSTWQRLGNYSLCRARRSWNNPVTQVCNIP